MEDGTTFVRHQRISCSLAVYEYAGAGKPFAYALAGLRGIQWVNDEAG